MNYIEQIKGLICNGKIHEASTNMFGDVINAVLGDPVSIGKVLITLTESPFFIREQLFWRKMESFLNGVYLSENDCSKLCAKLTENGDNRDNAIRLVECIDRAESQKKIGYLINATRCLLTDFIDRPTYFRVCHAITHTLDEDLVFLGVHINEEHIPYSSYTQGLLTAGLMYQSIIDANGEQKYSFTPIARIVDQYAVSYENIERYPTPNVLNSEQAPPTVSIPALEWQTIEKAQVEKALSKI